MNVLDCLDFLFYVCINYDWYKLMFNESLNKRLDKSEFYLNECYYKRNKKILLYWYFFK